MTSYFLPKLSEFSTPEQNDNNIYSEKAFNDDNSDLNKNLLTKDSEKEEKIKRVKYSINNSNIKDKARINDTNNNKEIEKCSKNIKLIFIPKKNIKTRNISIKNSYIKIKNSIPHSNNNTFINNIKKKNLKTVNNKIKNHSKNKLINYNDYYKFNGIISPYNNYKRKISFRKYMESFNIKNLTQNEDNAKKIKLNLSKNIRYKSPLSIKKINTSIRNNNSYKTLNKSNNLYMNNSEFNNKFLLPRKRSSKNNINIIINNNIETQKKGILHSNTNIDLGRYFINKSFNQHFNSKNQYKY
jgi:hypothetical protein